MFLADDGHGGDISIPAVIISLTDGNKIIDFYKNNLDKKIILEFQFTIEKKDNTVKYDIWFTADQENVYTFLKDFKRYHEALGNSAILNVHYITYPHFNYNPNSNEAKDDCLGSGKYCVRPGNLGINDGSLIVLESLKQKCIYLNAYSTNVKSKNILFWKYMNLFNEKCMLQNEKADFEQTCSNNVISEVGIDLNEINECVSNSFIATSSEKARSGYYKTCKNKLLDEDYELRKSFYISRVPSLTINGRLYEGAWRPEYVFDALCASLIKKPDVCYYEDSFQRQSEGFSRASTFVIILLVIAVNVILFLICKNFIRKRISERISSTDINTKIDTVVNSYLALKDRQ